MNPKASILILIFGIILGACAKQTIKRKAPDLQVADIPMGCTLMVHNAMPQIEQHVFGASGELRYSTVFDCGIREGASCKYFLYVSPTLGLPLEDYDCE